MLWSRRGQGTEAVVKQDGRAGVISGSENLSLRCREIRGTAAVLSRKLGVYVGGRVTIDRQT